MNNLIFGQEQVDAWAAIYRLIPGKLIKKLRKIPRDTLDNTEIRICCMHYLKADHSDIARILNISGSTLYTNNSHIRQKLGIEPKGNIGEFLETLL